MLSKACIKYFDTASWPIYLGFTQNEAAYKKEMQRLKVADPPAFVVPNADATTHCFYKPAQPATTIIVCLRPGLKGRSREQVAALVAHEAVHVWQEVCDAMGGDCRPRGEHEAYGIQWLTQIFLAEVWGCK